MEIRCQRSLRTAHRVSVSGGMVLRAYQAALPQARTSKACYLKGTQEVHEVLLLGGRESVVVGNHGIRF
jgi:hypothetical protein